MQMSLTDRDRSWVDRNLPRLAAVYDARFRWQLLAPPTAMYDLLADGEDTTLQGVVEHLCRHVDLPTVPTVRYEFGLRMAPDAAGEIRIGCNVKGGSLIRVPFFYVGKAYALGAILAHELAHHLNALLGIWESDCDENERLTDLSVVAAGLGKLTLNGLSTSVRGVMPISGYLHPDVVFYAYQLVNQHYRVAADDVTAGLLPDVEVLLEGSS
jgi:hypothetical protein